MKKIIEFSAMVVAAVAIAMIVHHFEVGKEISVFLKSVANKVVPWVDKTVYS